MDNYEIVFVQEDFDKLKDWISENLHFDLKQYNTSFLMRRINSRMFACKMNDYRSYLNLLEQRADERTMLLKNLTVNFTRFFRDKNLFKILKMEILPKILAKDSAVIWSAGCASGEEPYSVSILLSELAGVNHNVKIIATDIDSAALNQAMIGEYTLSQLAETSSDILKKYFKLEDGVYIVDEKIKSFVTFMQHDLFHDNAPRNVDLILCRNVVIYFTKFAKEGLYMTFYDSLISEGFLVLGSSETLAGEAREKFLFYNADEKIYQKKIKL